MKKYLLPLVALLMIIGLWAAEFALHSEGLQRLCQSLLTEGNAAFSVRTVTYNGGYAPRNAGVIWVTDSNNQFVKTIKVWANSYRYTLIRWIASSSQNMTGAITSASLNSHQLHNVTWNGKNWQNTEMPDGTYKFNIEFTEHNATAANMGKYKQVTFTKGSEPVTLTLPNETYFQNMSLNWTPVIVNGILSGTVTNEQGNPLAGALIEIGALNVTTSSSGFYSFSLPPGTYNLTCTAAGYHPLMLNDIQVTSAQTTTVNIPLATVSNQDDAAIVPEAVFAPVFPNPAQDTAGFKFFAAVPHDYTLRVYNARGQVVFSQAGPAKGGWQNTSWNGRDHQGRSCPSGIYSVKLSLGNQILQRKFTLVK